MSEITLSSPPSSSQKSLVKNKKSSHALTKFPLSIELESITLQKNRDILSFKKYLELGYKNYRTWLTMTLGSAFENNLNFCLARNINQFHPYVMGIDLETKYVIKKIENVFGVEQMKHYKHIIEKSICDSLPISPTRAHQITESYFNNPKNFEPILTDEEFHNRLTKVSEHDLDGHSFNCWRNNDHTKLNEHMYPITRDDILNGESLAPPSDKHIGIQMLQIHGFIPNITDVAKVKRYGVTFI